MLSILIWLPAAAALIGAIAGGERTSGGLTLLGSLGSLALAIDLITGYNGAAGGLTHVTDIDWIRALGIHYHLGVNGLNLFLVAMSALVRGTQSGFLRLYAALMLVGIAGVGLYFLIQG